MQCIYFLLMTISVFYELTGTKVMSSWHKVLKRVCNYMYVSLVFPVGMFVSFAFWGIYLVDRNLIWPVSFDSFIPKHQNHIMHTLPLIGVLIDMFVSRKTYGNSILTGYIPLFLATIGYTCWLIIIKHYTGHWVYPVFNVLSQTQLVLFFMAFNVVGAIFYVLGKHLNAYLWKKEAESKKNTKKT